MKSGLVVGWIIVPLVFLAVIVWDLHYWRSMVALGRQATTERNRLSEQIQAREREMAREMRAHAELLRDIKWSADGRDASAFLTGLAELGRGARLKIRAIGPLEQKAAPQFVKLWHTVQVLAAFPELKELVARIESEGGILEAVLLELPREVGPATAGAREEVLARFNATTLEPAADARSILRRIAAGLAAAQEPSLTLAIPPARGAPGLPIRNPFAFPATEAAKQVVSIEVSGIMGFPGGVLAIVNDYIVKVGDVVAGHRVKQITDSEVILREPGGGARSVALPPITAVRPSRPRR